MIAMSINREKKRAFGVKEGAMWREEAAKGLLLGAVI